MYIVSKIFGDFEMNNPKDGGKKSTCIGCFLIQNLNGNPMTITMF